MLFLIIGKTLHNIRGADFSTVPYVIDILLTDVREGFFGKGVVAQQFLHNLWQ